MKNAYLPKGHHRTDGSRDASTTHTEIGKNRYSSYFQSHFDDLSNPILRTAENGLVAEKLTQMAWTGVVITANIGAAD